MSVSVAPRVGAWIETWLVAARWSVRVSHPVWVRGLKLKSGHGLCNRAQSHPVWVRGLKPEYDRLGYESVDRRTPCGCVD